MHFQNLCDRMHWHYHFLLPQQPWPYNTTRSLDVCWGTWHLSTHHATCYFVRDSLHGLDLFAQHIPLTLNWIKIWGIQRQPQPLCFAHQTISKPLQQATLYCWQKPQPSGTIVTIKGYVSANVLHTTDPMLYPHGWQDPQFPSAHSITRPQIRSGTDFHCSLVQFGTHMTITGSIGTPIILQHM